MLEIFKFCLRISQTEISYVSYSVVYIKLTRTLDPKYHKIWPWPSQSKKAQSDLKISKTADYQVTNFYILQNQDQDKVKLNFMS